MARHRLDTAQPESADLPPSWRKLPSGDPMPDWVAAIDAARASTSDASRSSLAPAGGRRSAPARRSRRGGWNAGYARSMPDRDPIETDDAIVLVLGAPGGSEPTGHLEGVT